MHIAPEADLMLEISGFPFPSSAFTPSGRLILASNSLFQASKVPLAQ